MTGDGSAESMLDQIGYGAELLYDNSNSVASADLSV